MSFTEKVSSYMCLTVSGQRSMESVYYMSNTNASAFTATDTDVSCPQLYYDVVS